MKNETDVLKKEYNTNIACPSSPSVTMLEAYNDIILPKTQRLGYVQCYCMPQISILKTAILDLTFEEVAPGDTTTYCKSWFINYALQQGMVIGTSVVIVVINVLACTIFDKIASFEKR